MIGIVYGALVAMVQKDVKKLVAYSSVSHLGFVMLGLFVWNTQGLAGGILQSINHGLSTGALFLAVGILYERRHTREIAEFGGLAATLPWFAALFLIALGYRALRGREGLGGGDPKLFGALGAWLGWTQLPFVLVGAGLIGIAALLARRLRGGTVAATDRLPFGALMALAAWPLWIVVAR